MSCQASRHIKTTNIEAPDDPYIFTDTVLPTPPIFFKAQKSRARLNEGQYYNVNSYNTQQTALQSDGSINFLVKKAIVPHISVIKKAGTTSTIRKTHIAPFQKSLKDNLNNVEHLQKSLSKNQELKLHKRLLTNKKPRLTTIRTNVCIVRPQQPYLQKQESNTIPCGAALTIQPTLPLLTPTPSLWQTPLFVDTLAASKHILDSTSKITELKLSPMSPRDTTVPICSLEHMSTTTAMVAPIPMVASPTLSDAIVAVGDQTLPPSKFHHTTLAQHLEKVEGLKKFKKTNDETLQNRYSLKAPHLTLKLSSQPPPLKAFRTTIMKQQQKKTVQQQQQQMLKHSTRSSGTDIVGSDTDLSKIPVNVIFRKPFSNDEPTVQNMPILNVPKATTLRVKTMPNIKRDIAPLASTKSATTLPTIPKYVKHNINAPTFITKTIIKKLTVPHKLRGIVAGHKQVPNQQQTSSNESIAQNVKKPHPGPKSNNIKNKICKKNLCKQLTEQDRKQKLKTKRNQTIVPSQEMVSGDALNITATEHKLQVNATTTTATTAIATTPFTTTPLTTISDTGTCTPTALKIKTELTLSKNHENKNGIIAMCTSTVAATDAATINAAEMNTKLNFNDLPYCLQRYWLNSKETDSENKTREERIATRKNLLRRQALQLLATRSLQKLPRSLARHRVRKVDNILRTNHIPSKLISSKMCLYPSCTEKTLTMASHCLHHIINNTTQKIFTPCVAKRSDGLCRAPVFDLLHDIALCAEHRSLRTTYEQQYIATNSQRNARQHIPKKQPQHVQQQQHQQQQQQLHQPPAYNKVLPMNDSHRQKITHNGLLQSHEQSQMCVQNQILLTTPKDINNSPAIWAAPTNTIQKQWQNSATSLESLANGMVLSNRQSGIQTMDSPILQRNNNSSTYASLPALVPLSNNSVFNDDVIKKNKTTSLTNLTFNDNDMHIKNLDNSFNNNRISDIKECDLNSSPLMDNANTILSSVAMTRYTDASNELAITKKLFSENINNMFNICDNNSPYASSEDTGLGGLSESELIGPHDADDIPLGDTRLLEEHDLANVLSTLPVDAFTELFTSVRQDECDEMDRQLELADRHLRSLQQSIGSDTDFLGDFINDDILGGSEVDISSDIDFTSAVIQSPTSSGIADITDTAAFLDGNASVSNNSLNEDLTNHITANNCSIIEMRELVKT